MDDTNCAKVARSDGNGGQAFPNKLQNIIVARWFGSPTTWESHKHTHVACTQHGVLTHFPHTECSFNANRKRPTRNRLSKQHHCGACLTHFWHLAIHRSATTTLRGTGEAKKNFYYQSYTPRFLIHGIFNTWNF